MLFLSFFFPIRDAPYSEIISCEVTDLVLANEVNYEGFMFASTSIFFEH